MEGRGDIGNFGVQIYAVSWKEKRPGIQRKAPLRGGVVHQEKAKMRGYQRDSITGGNPRAIGGTGSG